MANTKRPAHVIMIGEIKMLEGLGKECDAFADYARSATIGGFLHVLMNMSLSENDEQEVITQLEKLGKKYPDHGYEKTVSEMKR